MCVWVSSMVCVIKIELYETSMYWVSGTSKSIPRFFEIRHFCSRQHLMKRVTERLIIFLWAIPFMKHGYKFHWTDWKQSKGKTMMKLYLSTIYQPPRRTQHHTPATFTGEETASTTHWIGGWKDPKADLDLLEVTAWNKVLEKIKFLMKWRQSPPPVYGASGLIIVFTKACYWTLYEHAGEEK
jgi:hypothetical protein